MRFYITSWSCFEKRSTEQVSDLNVNHWYYPVSHLYSDMKINVATLNTVVLCGQTTKKKDTRRESVSFVTPKIFSFTSSICRLYFATETFPSPISLCV